LDTRPVVLNYLDVEKFCDFGKTLGLDSLVLQQTGTVVLLVAEQDLTQIFEVVGDEKSSNNDGQQMEIYRELVLAAELPLLWVLLEELD
jgi:hypothetical protein